MENQHDHADRNTLAASVAHAQPGVHRCSRRLVVGAVLEQFARLALQHFADARASVSNRTPRTLPDFSSEMFCSVMPTRSASSRERILRRASITSRCTTIAIQTKPSFSSASRTASDITVAMAISTAATSTPM